MQKENGVTEDEMFRWHHRLNGHEFEQTLGDSKGQGSLECCSPWGYDSAAEFKRPDYTFRQGFTGVPAAAGGSEIK